MKIINDKPLSALVYIVLILVFIAVPSSFSQSIKNSTSLVPPSNILQEQETNSTNNIHIMKTSANSYNLVNGQTVLVGTFDTTYTITGSSNSLNKSKDLIISTIQDDFDKSPIIGYVRAGNASEVFEIGNSTIEGQIPAALPNPFVDQQRINSTIAQQLSHAIASVDSPNFTIAEIKCDFGINIENWQCEDYSILT
jgi:hypothetical protein